MSEMVKLSGTEEAGVRYYSYSFQNSDVHPFLLYHCRPPGSKCCTYLNRVDSLNPCEFLSSVYRLSISLHFCDVFCA